MTLSEPFDPVRLNRWTTVGCYLARSVIASSATYPYSTSARIYNIKVYKEQ